MCSENCQSFLFFLNLYFIKNDNDIQFNESFCFFNLFKSLIDQEKRVAILSNDVIQIIIIDTEA